MLVLLSGPVTAAELVYLGDGVDGAHRARAVLGDLLVGQLAVLEQHGDFLTELLSEFLNCGHVKTSSMDCLSSKASRSGSTSFFANCINLFRRNDLQRYWPFIGEFWGQGHGDDIFLWGN